MAIVKQESRCRVGIVWYDTEQEAQKVSDSMFENYPAQSIADANIGYVQCGRDAAFDMKDESGAKVGFAVVTP